MAERISGSNKPIEIGDINISVEEMLRVAEIAHGVSCDIEKVVTELTPEMERLQNIKEFKEIASLTNVIKDVNNIIYEKINDFEREISGGHWG